MYLNWKKESLFPSSGKIMVYGTTNAYGNCMDNERLSHVFLTLLAPFLFGFLNLSAQFCIGRGQEGARTMSAVLKPKGIHIETTARTHSRTHTNINANLLYFIFLFYVWFRTYIKCCVYGIFSNIFCPIVHNYAILLDEKNEYVLCCVQTLECSYYTTK